MYLGQEVWHCCVCACVDVCVWGEGGRCGEKVEGED